MIPIVILSEAKDPLPAPAPVGTRVLRSLELPQDDREVHASKLAGSGSGAIAPARMKTGI